MATLSECRPSGPHTAAGAQMGGAGSKTIPRPKIACAGLSPGARRPGCRVASTRGGLLCRFLRQLCLPLSIPATARLLELIREFDARGGWNTGFRSCAAWLSWRVGLDLGAARERVRVARALATLPRLARALARGELSYAKVRALTRVATPETEARLVAVGRAGTACHVERIVRGWRRVDRQAEAKAAAQRHN